jgi:hypothetical protein
MLRFLRLWLDSLARPMGAFSGCPWQIDGYPSGPLVALSAGAMYRRIDDGLRIVGTPGCLLNCP